MTKIKGMCRNEDCEMCDQIQEAEKSNFKCEKCGKDLIPFGNKTSEPGGGLNKKLIGIIAGALEVVVDLVGSIIGFVLMIPVAIVELLLRLIFGKF